MTDGAASSAPDTSRRALAFVTMVRGDHEMLARWISHHGALAGTREALHIVAHGSDPRISGLAQGCSQIVLPYDPEGRDFEPRRVAMFFGLVAGLLGYYRHIVVLDTDEFLVAAPDCAPARDLAGYLDNADLQGVALSPLGFDLVHRPSVEPGALDWTRPITAQRRHGFMHVAYSKPCIFRRPPRKGGNQHRLRDQPMQIDPNLMLLHLRFADKDHGLRVSRQRSETVALFDAAGSGHRIGTWTDRERHLAQAIADIEASPCPDLRLADRRRFSIRQMELYARHGGRVLWKRGRSAGYRLPDEWVGCL